MPASHLLAQPGISQAWFQGTECLLPDSAPLKSLLRHRPCHLQLVRTSGAGQTFASGEGRVFAGLH